MLDARAGVHRGCLEGKDRSVGAAEATAVLHIAMGVKCGVRVDQGIHGLSL